MHLVRRASCGSWFVCVEGRPLLTLRWACRRRGAPWVGVPASKAAHGRASAGRSEKAAAMAAARVRRTDARHTDARVRPHDATGKEVDPSCTKGHRARGRLTPSSSEGSTTVRKRKARQRSRRGQGRTRFVHSLLTRCTLVLPSFCRYFGDARGCPVTSEWYVVALLAVEGRLFEGPFVRT